MDLKVTHDLHIPHPSVSIHSWMKSVICDRAGSDVRHSHTNTHTLNICETHTRTLMDNIVALSPLPVCDRSLSKAIQNIYIQNSLDQTQNYHQSSSSVELGLKYMKIENPQVDGFEWSKTGKGSGDEYLCTHSGNIVFTKYYMFFLILKFYTT